ncbi:hypothetical protein [Aquabacterium sp. OR-4]|uniref:hypothetical protein n=1 Tax=Aquabacterium sp. OR-4 TaxID=2978127 RepID=UPI0021B1A97C|nr:hypothetical protein [Aquabacterium sp. OR-4]MDT7836633.1 hypothetical protein [Aquabacterium sp. OR-4]
MADTITSTRLTLPTNTGAEVRFNTLAEVVRFAELNARRVSNTLEALRSERAHLDELLRHEELADVARQQHADAVRHREVAASALAAAEQTVATIKDMIRAERDAHTKATQSAAARLLALVKAGTPPAQVDTSSSDRIATMELSQASAEGEAAQARQVLGQAEREVEMALQRILAAEARGAEARYLAAQEAYAAALAGFAVAHYRAHRRAFVVPDLRPHAQQALAKAGF